MHERAMIHRSPSGIGSSRPTQNCFFDCLCGRPASVVKPANQNTECNWQTKRTTTVFGAILGAIWGTVDTNGCCWAESLVVCNLFSRFSTNATYGGLLQAQPRARASLGRVPPLPACLMGASCLHNS